MPTVDEYEDFIDEALDEGDVSQDLADAQIDQYETATYSSAKKTSDIYSWFWKVVRLNTPKQAIKTGNLSNPEIGEAKVSIRDAMNLAMLGEIFNHNKFADYWRETAGITAASSMAKKGWFMDLSISQKRVRQRAKGVENNQKRRMFGGRRDSSESNE